MKKDINVLLREAGFKMVVSEVEGFKQESVVSVQDEGFQVGAVTYQDGWKAMGMVPHTGQFLISEHRCRDHAVGWVLRLSKLMHSVIGAGEIGNPGETVGVDLPSTVSKPGLPH